MTQILLRPLRPRGDNNEPAVLLRPPWAWWETRAVADRAGNIMVVEQNSDEYVVTFGHDGDAVILTDPPAMHLLQVTVYDDRLWMESRRVMLENYYLLARVVWHEQPGPQWQPVPGRMTCLPGYYLQECEQRPADGRSGRRDYMRYEPAAVAEPFERTELRPLDWPIVPTVRTRQPGADVADVSHTHIVFVNGHFAYRVQADAGRSAPSTSDDSCTVCTGQLVLTNDRDHLICLGCGAVTGRHGAPSKAAHGPSVLPESQVVDEIDRLVNESIRPGPRDDYTVDRYPKCDQCPHSWHGLECDTDGCDCLNTSWLQSS